MNAAVALVGLTLGQPAAPAPNYYPMASKNIKIPIKYEHDRKGIRQVKLYVARNGENTWYQEAAVTPDREFFTYTAKEDGVYWFTMVEEDLQGRNVPADLTRTPPDMKILVDTVQPRVQFTTAKRDGEEVSVEWLVDDKNPDEGKTQVHFRPAGTDGYWKEVTLPASSRSGVRFPAGTAAPVTVRVTAYDLAGNKTEQSRDVGGNGTGTNTSTSMSSPPPGGMGGGAGGAAIPPPDLGPLAPLSPSGSPPPAATGGASPPQGNSGAAGAGGGGGTSTQGAGFSQGNPLPTVDPRQPAPPATTGGSGGTAPVAVWSAGTGGHAAPSVEMSRAQFINYLAFDMGYEIESRGPSGISRVDLWVTRDDGRTWLKWPSHHDGKTPSVRVNLAAPSNTQHEGMYGFRVVPVSGAGLSEREPAAGDAPDMRVVVDTTPPTLDLFPPVGDPTSPDALVIRWKATDRNFGEDPITIEWSDSTTGAWQPVASAGDLLQVGAGQAPQAKRLPNTGQFAWRVPAGLPPRVFLKVTARDAAGNVREVVTRDSIVVDLVKPRAKISGIVAPAGGVRP